MVVSSAPAGAGVGIMIWRSIQGFRFAPPLATFARPFGAKRSGIIILLAQGRQDTMWVRLRASALTFAHKSRKCDALPPGVREGGVHQQALLRKNPPCVHGGLNGGLKPPEHSIAIGSRADQTLALLERPRSLLRKPPPAPAARSGHLGSRTIISGRLGYVANVSSPVGEVLGSADQAGVCTTVARVSTTSGSHCAPLQRRSSTRASWSESALR